MNNRVQRHSNWDPVYNGGFNNGNCSFNIENNSAEICGTEQFINAVNTLQDDNGTSAGLCGFNDWHLPPHSLRQLVTCFSCEAELGPFIEQAFFPNTHSSWYWTNGNTWDHRNSQIELFNGTTFSDIGHSERPKETAGYVRLIRSD